MSSLNIECLGYLFIDKEVDNMTTNTKNKKDILDKVKDILNKKDTVEKKN
ncbi:hypothetical protein GCM10007342_04410 [Staphylococcus pragensis]|nr:hypothetical protein GCM10007342_04410 [Staphylococcus pragensis]